MNTFNDMGLTPVIMKSLAKLDFQTPTPIQLQTIPLAIQGQDIIGSAQTGTGKTLAFCIPMIESLIQNPDKAALILAPTRELAQQVVGSIRDLLGGSSQLKTALIIGGEAMGKQLIQLKCNPRIIVGTPGRVIDHMKRKTMKFRNIEFLVLDEMDRMFDMGFGIQLEEIISQLPKQRQTLMFSATMAPQIEKLAQRYLIDPKRVSVGSTTQPGEGIKQDVLYVKEADKYSSLLEQLQEREGSIIIFVKTKIGAQKLADKLCDEDHRASAIHGDLRQHKRERILKGFRNGHQRIMVATDIAARGIDIPHIQHVINYDLPQAPEDYIHRIGRTGRAGAQGSALCMVTSQDRRKWSAIDLLMNPGRSKAQNNKEKTPDGFFQSEPKKARPARKSFKGKFGEAGSFSPRAERDSFGNRARPQSRKPALNEFRAAPEQGTAGPKKFFKKPDSASASSSTSASAGKFSRGAKPSFGDKKTSFKAGPNREGANKFGDKKFGDKKFGANKSFKKSNRFA